MELGEAPADKFFRGKAGKLFDLPVHLKDRAGLALGDDDAVVRAQHEQTVSFLGIMERRFGALAYPELAMNGKVKEQRTRCDKKPAFVRLQYRKGMLIGNERFKDPVRHGDPETPEKEVEDDNSKQ